MDRNKDALTPIQRDLLFGKIREDDEFRDLMKRDWQSALEQLNIDPELVGETLENGDEKFALSPLSEVFMVINNTNKFELDSTDHGVLDAVNFEARQ